MTDGLKDKYRKAIIEILTANERVEKVVLFGSRAMGTFTPTSDVDIALFGDQLTMTDQAKLAEAIDELSIPQRVDILLYKSIKNEKLIEHIKRHGVEWYRRAWAIRTFRKSIR
ncbi:MAG: nucleotidyltransferase domain-containing protein [Thermodesulfobacteriota bacterium]|nr:nucleotidyltransferase domain-containing protein [Thermodesulfobacteriota bacterium]